MKPEGGNSFLKSTFHTRIGRYFPTSYYIRGGLGSQIIDFILIEYLKTTHPRLVADLSYFAPTKNPVSNTQISRWNWELGDYGISFDQHKSKIPVAKKISIQDLSKYDIRNAFSNENLLRVLPNLRISKSVSDEISILDLPNIYAAIHIRQGDYLSVSNRIIKIDEVLNFVERIKNLLPDTIVICSDAIFPNEDINLFYKSIQPTPACQ